MKCLLTGASGFLGSALTKATVYTLVRRTPRHGREICWRPDEAYVDVASIPQIDVVVHLAGENIAGGRWSAKRKARIRNSRINGTQLLANTLAHLDERPQTLISASAVGFYGHRQDEVLTEDSPAGTGFLPEVCQAWENAALPAIDAGIRTVFPRIGMVLSAAGGALAKMRLPFRLGLGGTMGSGRQYMSWISVDDLIKIILYAADTPAQSGPINAVSPTPVTNLEFTQTLGRVLSRPTLLPLPAPLARFALGEMADALLLASTRVLPARLQAANFPFSHPSLESALLHTLSQ